MNFVKVLCCKISLCFLALTLHKTHSCLLGTEELTNRNVLVKTEKYEINNPQIVAQHCFVASFRRCFPLHLALINLNRNEIICCGLKKCGALIGWFARARANCVFDEKRGTKPKSVAQLEVDPRSTFCCASSWSRKVKNGKHRRKLATKQCCTSSWRFLYLDLRRLYVAHAGSVWEQNKRLCTVVDIPA